MSGKSSRTTLLMTAFLLAALLTASCGQESNNKAPNGQQDRAEVPKVVPRLPLLINVSDLKKHLDGGKIRVLDVRSTKDYASAHVPGAVRVDMKTWKAQALAKGGLHNTQVWSKTVGDLGIAPQRHVVVYADHPTKSTRIWWTLKYLGVENVAILDGGWKHWQQDGGKTSSEVPEIKPVKFSPKYQTDRLAEIGDLKTSYGSDDLKLIDTRSEGEYTKGRIPGAVRLEWKELLAEDGRFKSVDKLKAIFSAQGLDHAKTAVTYCQTGGRASLDAFALELAGFPKVKNYYCSWGEWSADGKAPIEK